MNILYCGVVFILLYNNITSTLLLLDLSQPLKGGGICVIIAAVAPPGVGITVLVVVVGGVVMFLCFLWK